MLIVDDAPAALRDYLEGKRYEVLSAESASDLIDTVRMRRPHVVVLDVNLARTLGGAVVIAAIGATAPVIVSAAEADVERAGQAMRDGAFDVVMKPFDFRSVRQLIEVAVQHAPDLL